MSQSLQQMTTTTTTSTTQQEDEYSNISFTNVIGELFINLTSPLVDACQERVNCIDISSHDNWMSSLKVLVNLTHHCECNCIIVNDLVIHNKPLISVVVEVLTDLLLFRQRHQEAINNQSRLKLTVIDKFVYDGILYALTLLCNLVEINDETKKGTLLESIVVDTQQEGASQRCEMLLSHKLKMSLDCVEVNFVDFLLKAFEYETRNLIHDFRDIPTSVATTPQVNDKSKLVTSSSCLVESPVVDKGVVDNVKNEMTPPRSFSSLVQSPPSSSSIKKSSNLPLDEIVVATHLVLLLHAISSSLVDKKDHQEQNIRCRLPSQTWWLPVRVLKAYIALQDQTATLVQENSFPIVQAIQHMQDEDNQQVMKNEVE